ncbi:MAG: hypothetical protein KGL58_01275 [Pseudomonadota bacterium]|nr:hypothetical protein [Pseudomonadota bacterium]
MTAYCFHIAYADDFIVYSPYVTKNQSEIELRTSDQLDNKTDINGTRAIQASISHAWTSWWRPEIYIASYQHRPGVPFQHSGYEFENVFQLAPEGKYWVDSGFLLSYAYKSQPGIPSTLEFGPLFEKQEQRFIEQVNFIWEKQIGRRANNQYAFRTDASLIYHISQSLSPGIEMYLRPVDHSYQIGPVFSGEIPCGEHGSEMEYRLGTVLGINKAAPNVTLLGSLSYEFF